MKEIKIIDLLNRIANGEEVPKEIVFEDKKYKYNTGIDYENEYGDYLLSVEPVCISFLNTKVEIIEEEKKIPEKLTPFEAPFLKNDEPDIRFRLIIDSINEICDYLKSKGE